MWPRGKDCKLYEGAAAAILADMIDVPIVQEASINSEKGEVVNTARGDDFESKRGTVKSLTIDFKMRHEPNSVPMAAIRNAYLNDTPIELAALTADKDDEDADGPKGTFDIIKMSRNEPLEGQGVNYDCTATLITLDEWLGSDWS